MKINNDKIISLEHSLTKTFDYNGCENCNNNLGNDVYTTKAYFDNFKDYYIIQLCHECLCAWHNAEVLDKNCKNTFEM